MLPLRTMHTGCACEAEDHSDQLGTVGTHPARSVAIAPRCGQIHIFIMGTDHPTGVSVTRGVWNNYTLQVTFINDTVSGFYNGAPVLQGAPFSSTGTTLGLYAFDAQGGSPLGGTDSIYFDNLSVTASASNGATLVSLAVTPGNSTMQAGTTLQLAATGTYGDGSAQNLTNAVSWRSSNTAIATINSSGLVTGVIAGSSTITATSGTVTGTTGLTSVARPRDPQP